MAHLKACGEWELSALDKSHPVVASATMAELEAALAEASRLLRCPLESKVERWLGGATELSCGSFETWTPLRDARCANLNHRRLRDGSSFLVNSVIEVFQVCYRSTGGHKLYHIQPLSSPEAAGYFFKRYGQTEPKRLEAPIHSDFTPTRGPYSMMSDTMVNHASEHTSFGDIPQWELSLHTYILRYLP